MTDMDRSPPPQDEVAEAASAESKPPEPYRYRIQFDEAMGRAAGRLMAVEHPRVRAWYWVVSLAVVALGLFVGFYFQVPGAILVILMPLGIWYATRTTRLARRIVRERLCLRCGYRLLESPVNEQGHGICPECGRAFSTHEYIRPPRRLHRVE